MAISPVHPGKGRRSPSSSARRVKIRPAVRRDLPWVLEIYNAAVRIPGANLEVNPWDSPRIETWFAAFGPRDRVLVAEMDGEVIGFASFGAFRPKGGYEHTKECSVYVASGTQNRGVASQLYRALIRAAMEVGCKTLVAVVVGDNQASKALHLKFGFEASGVLYDAGFKHERWHDAHLFQLRLPDPHLPHLPPCA